MCTYTLYIAAHNVCALWLFARDKDKYLFRSAIHDDKLHKPKAYMLN